MVECTNCKTQWADVVAFCGRCGGKTQPMAQAPRRKLFLVPIAVLGITYFVIETFSSIKSTTVKTSTDVPYLREFSYTPIEAAELANAYEANEIRADLNYEGKQYRVSGKITGIGKEILGSPYLIIDNKVQAVFDRKEEDALTRYDKGMLVTANCTVSGKLVWVLLKDCRL